MTTKQMLRFSGLAIWLPIKWTWKLVIGIILVALFIVTWTVFDS